MAAAITRTRKEVLFPSADHLTLPRNAVVPRLQKLASDHPAAMSRKAAVAWTTDCRANASRRRALDPPTPTALRPLAKGWPRNEDNPGFDPEAGTNRIAVVATTEARSAPTPRTQTTLPLPKPWPQAQRADRG